MNTKKRYLYLSLFFILSGCVTEKGYWYKEGLTQDELAKVRYICLQQSRQYQNYNSHRSNALGDEFKGQASSMMPMNVGQRREQALMRGFEAGFNMGSRAIDENKINELKLFEACMNAQGIYWETEK